MWLKYELAISLYDLNVTKLPLSDWQLLQINTLQNRRSTKLHFTATNKLRCGLNILPNRFKTITNRIDTNWLTLTKETYKQKCKKSLLHHSYYLIDPYPLIYCWEFVINIWLFYQLISVTLLWPFNMFAF
jgi:hypothetical protein